MSRLSFRHSPGRCMIIPPPITIELIALLRVSPGGVTDSEIREMMRRHGYSERTIVERTIDGLPDDIPVWGERDETGETWWKLCSPNDKIRREVPRMEQAKKGKEKDKVVMVSPELWREIEHYTTDHGGSNKSLVEAAVREYLERRAE